MIACLTPDWPAPPWVRACATTRRGGISRGPFAELNLADHVGDDPHAVRYNRARLREHLDLPAEPLWLRQIHGCDCLRAETLSSGAAAEAATADAAVTGRAGVVCAVLTADCLPILLCTDDGRQVGAVHAGWRGLAAGVLDSALRMLSCPASRVLAWIGPGIGPSAFEVGGEVREAFMRAAPEAAAAFQPRPGGRWLADLPALARQRLAAAGVTHIVGGDLCTYSQSRDFFSYRRDGTTGRMASLIWLQSSGER